MRDDGEKRGKNLVEALTSGGEIFWIRICPRGRKKLGI